MHATPVMLSMNRIEEARAFLAGRLRRTPVEESPGLSKVLGAPVWLKLEMLQVTGSFKVRGAFWKLSRLTEAERRGFMKLVSRIFPENVASRRLCAALGFLEVGVYRRHGQLDGRWMDCVIVERLLGVAAQD